MSQSGLIPLADPAPNSSGLLAWYDRHRRDLPWRAPPGVRADPYRVWLSEIMLQQTTVVTVAPYFDRFVARWPSVSALAAASLDEVLHQWQGLGYYARARNLHACAKVIVARHGGRFPDDVAGLRALPGIGDYTAAAIAAIAFDRREAAVDGNVERVAARIFAVREPMPGAKPRLRALARDLVPARRAGDFAQALMDLGATICTPRRPRCVELSHWRLDDSGEVIPSGGRGRGHRSAMSLPGRTPNHPKGIFARPARVGDVVDGCLRRTRAARRTHAETARGSTSSSRGTRATTPRGRTSPRARPTR